MTLVLETERLFMRQLTRDDLPWLIELRSAEAVNRYLGGPEMQNAEKLDKRIDFYISCYKEFGYGFCAIGIKATGELIGTGGLQPLEDTGETEVGYNFSERYWRQGYGYECAMGWLRYGFETRGLERIVAIADPDNVGSWRIMEKCGMKYEKTAVYYGIKCVFYAISREEFNQLPK